MEKKPKIERLQDSVLTETEVSRQKELIVEALPEFKSIFIIARRPANSDKTRNFASCSMDEIELYDAILNLMIAEPQTARPICSAALKYVNLCEKMMKSKKN